MFKRLKQLCTPAYVYFLASMLFMVISAIQNFGNKSKYVLGMYACDVPSCTAIFIAKFIYILFWTWILNLICKDGQPEIAWLLIFLPFILLFVVIAIMMILGRKTSESMQAKVKPYIA